MGALVNSAALASEQEITAGTTFVVAQVSITLERDVDEDDVLSEKHQPFDEANTIIRKIDDPTRPVRPIPPLLAATPVAGLTPLAGVTPSTESLAGYRTPHHTHTPVTGTVPGVAGERRRTRIAAGPTWGAWPAIGEAAETGAAAACCTCSPKSARRLSPSSRSNRSWRASSTWSSTSCRPSARSCSCATPWISR